MTAAFIVGIASVFLVLLLIFEKREKVACIFLTKPFLSLLFVLTAWRQTDPGSAYAAWILAGLILSLAGDVCLIFSSRRMFLSGLVVFLMGHLCYAVAFYTHAAPGAWTWASLAAVTLAGVGIFLWLQPFLGNMKGPVAAYILVISLMVAGAASVMGDFSIVAPGRRLVFGGALSFYLSDIFVARQRFVRPGYLNRAVGLPLYYLGQFLLAFSIAHV